MSAFVIALLGAESTGKTTLARELGTALAGRGERVAVVAEYLREFCEREGRTPRREEQRGIAAEQSRRIAADWIFRFFLAVHVALCALRSGQGAEFV